MKKLLILLLSAAIFLSACGRKDEVIAQTEGISFVASVEFGEQEAECFIKAYGGGMFSCRVDSPEEVKGLTADFDGDKVTISYMGLSREFETPLPAENLAEIVRSIVASASGKTALREGEVYTVNGVAGGYPYVLTVAASGLPLSVSCERLDFHAEISSVTLLKKNTSPQ